MSKLKKKNFSYIIIYFLLLYHRHVLLSYNIAHNVKLPTPGTVAIYPLHFGGDGLISSFVEPTNIFFSTLRSQRKINILYLVWCSSSSIKKRVRIMMTFRVDPIFFLSACFQYNNLAKKICVLDEATPVKR